MNHSENFFLLTMNNRGEFTDNTNKCSNCGEEIYLGHVITYEVSSGRSLLFCSEKCRKEWLLKNVSVHEKNSFSKCHNNFFR